VVRGVDPVADVLPVAVELGPDAAEDVPYSSRRAYALSMRTSTIALSLLLKPSISESVRSITNREQTQQMHNKKTCTAIRELRVMRCQIRRIYSLRTFDVE